MQGELPDLDGPRRPADMLMWGPDAYFGSGHSHECLSAWTEPSGAC